VSVNKWLNVMSHYDDFFLNVWTDNHIYKTIW